MKVNIKAFTLIELLVVIFILTMVSFFTIPALFRETILKDEIALASYLRALREDSVTSKKETQLTINFKDRYFSFKSDKSEKKLTMKEDESWEVLVPARGVIKDGQVTIIFPPFPSEDFLAFYLNRNGNVFTILLNNITGEVEIFKEKKEFYD
ncbi:MAG: type II secretion system GspH family protein [Proteobacteria bacterium]|nr:type II secretion system GspH family protein [Pseudomonadota bacterium]